MGFLFFTLLLLPVMLLYAAAATLLEPFRPVLQPIWDWLNAPGVFYLISQIIIAASLLLFVVLLAARFRWKRAGKLDREYIYSVRGWARLRRRLVKLVLSWGPLWELAWAAAFYVSILAGFIPPAP